MKNQISLLMCEPRFYDVEYAINPWMEGNIGRVDHRASKEQWNRLRAIVAPLAKVDVIEPVSGLPDMTFAANGGLIYEEVFVPARYRFPQRQPEAPHFAQWFRERRYRIAELGGEVTFEGEGDALVQPGRPLLWGGYGHRTSLAAYRGLAEIFDVEIVPLRLIDERFYHLDTCLCPLPEDRLLYYPGAFDAESLEIIRRRIPAGQRFEVGATDALNFACNALVLDRAFIANFISNELGNRLASWGYEATVCPLSQFMLSGGSAKCLVLHLNHPAVPAEALIARQASTICEREVWAEGHLLDRGLANRMLDCAKESGCDFAIGEFQVAQSHEQLSSIRFRIIAPSQERLKHVLERLLKIGAKLSQGETDARLEPVKNDGVAPQDFYGTTIYPTEVRIRGQWTHVAGQRMDAVIVVRELSVGPEARCTLIRNLKAGERVVCSVEGIRIHTHHETQQHEPFGFMTAPVSSERRVEAAIEDLAWEMRRARERMERIVVVAGPVVIHTGGGPHLARLIRLGYVQALLGGNAIAVHDIEQAFFGTSLGVDLRRGGPAHGGHQHHLRAINSIRASGGIAAAVRQGILRQGVMYECIVGNVPFCLAGSIRDDGPLPETQMNLIAAHEEYAHIIRGASMVLMLASTLHSIGAGNMTPAGVRLVCVDINPSVAVKLADRGSTESWSIVTDVGLFLRLLADQLEEEY
jgi:lysine-ketoglutarate reductase/saccharopine dehydrogenase-like protein (TIGR00300 family)